LDDLGVIWGQGKRSDTVQSARDYVRSGSLTRIRRGVYGITGRNFSALELANKLIVPSYVSGETVLAKHGLTFQYTDSITSMACYGKRLSTDYGEFAYHQVKPTILYETRGIIRDGNVLIASMERAIADLLYISRGSYRFEHLHGVDWKELASIAEIYGSLLPARKVEELRSRHA
jgi:hypothetical protein